VLTLCVAGQRQMSLSALPNMYCCTACNATCVNSDAPLSHSSVSSTNSSTGGEPVQKLRLFVGAPQTALCPGSSGCHPAAAGRP